MGIYIETVTFSNNLTEFTSLQKKNNGFYKFPTVSTTVSTRVPTVSTTVSRTFATEKLLRLVFVHQSSRALRERYLAELVRVKVLAELVRVLKNHERRHIHQKINPPPKKLKFVF